MTVYKNISGKNQDTFGQYVEGVLNYKVGHIRVDEKFNAQDLGGVLRLDNGQYVYDRATVFAPQPVAPPPPDPDPEPPASDKVAFTLSVDGYETYHGELTKR